MDPGPRRTFRFGRATVEARPGDTLLSAVARRGWPYLARSIRYHRPRGPFCGVGDCTGCLVRVNGQPNVRSCLRPAADGDVVRTENAWPSPRFDVLGILDRVLPHGVDTVHGLRRPAWAAALYQSVGRRLAGFGHAPDPGSAPPAGARTYDAEVAIVGGGDAGRAVAAALVRRGVRPLVLERRSGPGSPLPGAELLDGVTAVTLPAPVPGNGTVVVGFDAHGGGVVARARSVVLATGGYDAGLLFEGSDRPGVVTADLALSDLGLPLGPAVVVGGGPRVGAVLERLDRQVEAVVAFGEITPEVTRAAVDRGIPLYPRSRLVRSLGRGRVRAVELARRDGSGTFRLECRSVVLAHRRLPNAQLAFQAGVGRRWFDAPGAYYPFADRVGRTDVPGLIVAGSAARPAAVPGPTADEVAQAVVDGPRAATSTDPTPGAPGEILPYYRELLGERRHGKWVVCACEDVLLEELERAVERGYRGLELGMRYTGVGTGLCQGRYCLLDAIVVLSLLEGRPPNEVGHVTQRPPLVPMPLGALAALHEQFAREETA